MKSKISIYDPYSAKATQGKHKNTLPYDHHKIEKKWQKVWEKDGIYKAQDPSTRSSPQGSRLSRAGQDKSKKPKYYCLIEFPYPSGDGLHVGHIRSNTAMDIIARKRRMEGYNVLYPIGWDAFGLPTENYAIKTGIHPTIITKKNTDTFRRQLREGGFSFDWDREVDTSSPEYYKWTQWIFLQLLKNGLAYKKKMPVNWCISCKIGLANEEVIDGHCERCGGTTDKREKEQWMLAITKYADRLDKDLDLVDYLPKIKTQQRNWIGRSEGAEIEFGIIMNAHHGLDLSAHGQEGNSRPDPIRDSLSIKVFTTRPDTVFGATYLVLAPDHLFVQKEILNSKSEILNKNEIEKYINEAKNKTEIERTAEGREKTGVKLMGVRAINPANQKEIPVFIADYVLSHYGTGAIMAVPAHDARDFEFATKYDLPIVPVIVPRGQLDIRAELYVGEGIMVNSGQFNGLPSENVKDRIIKFIGGGSRTTYKLRDWVFSRQRYWGEPIPVIHCNKCALRDPSGQGIVPVAPKDLPVKLPNVKNYKPTETGESPLASVVKWVNVRCPKCKGKAKRETDTMPNWAGSSWYYLAYCLGTKNLKRKIKNNGLKEFKKFFDLWLPVDWYNGGMEHTTLHLLYSRFWHKFLYDIGCVPTKEPYKKRTSHGLILADGGEKMSKSKGNIINPDSIVNLLGADTLRVYEMFMGPFGESIAWNPDGVAGSRRFLERVWRAMNKVSSDKKVSPEVDSTLLNRTIKKVGDDIEEMKFNTAISALMILLNEFEKLEVIPRNFYEIYLILLSPFAPHITEELWAMLGNNPDASAGAGKSIHLSVWPKYKLDYKKNNKIKIVIQVNSKVRDFVEVLSDIDEGSLKGLVIARPNVKKWIDGQVIRRIIIVKNRLINVVI